MECLDDEYRKIKQKDVEWLLEPGALPRGVRIDGSGSLTEVLKYLRRCTFENCDRYAALIKKMTTDNHINRFPLSHAKKVITVASLEEWKKRYATGSTEPKAASRAEQESAVRRGRSRRRAASAGTGRGRSRTRTDTPTEIVSTAEPTSVGTKIRNARLCLSHGMSYWNPFNAVVDFMERERVKVHNFTTVQAKEVTKYIEEQKKSMEFAIEHSREELVKTKKTVIHYFDEQTKIIEDAVKNYTEKAKQTGKTIIDKVSSYRSIEKNEDDQIKNPDVVLTVPAIVLRNGYPCETHSVMSQGYVLNLHRIPHSKNKRIVSSKTVLLQHGLFASSADWILNGPGKGLAYVLADAGYDVWMANVRGNRYSREHTKYAKDTKSYWNFSWHDIALHDQPAIIEYIINTKDSNAKITYIGHSMGTTILFAMLSLRPEYNDILHAGFALAPVVLMSDIRSPLKDLAPMAGDMAYVDILLGNYEFVPKSSSLGQLSASCDIDRMDSLVCKNLLFYLCGYDEPQFNMTLLPAIVAHLGAGTSWKTVVHFSQEIVAKKFQQYDYGYPQNMYTYGSPQPPEYDLSRVTLPITLFWAKNDLLSSESDVMELRRRLPNTTRAYLAVQADVFCALPNHHLRIKTLFIYFCGGKIKDPKSTIEASDYNRDISSGNLSAVRFAVRQHGPPRPRPASLPKLLFVLVALLITVRWVPYLKRKKRNPYRITLLSVCPSVRPSVRLVCQDPFSQERVEPASGRLKARQASILMNSSTVSTLSLLRLHHLYVPPGSRNHTEHYVLLGLEKLALEFRAKGVPSRWSIGQAGAYVASVDSYFGSGG
ncbi:Lipase 3 [Eumeta japonica]|uniref:Lipase 3 n=1 Tax=Eumeta variegata TaxID=151549 RepID=A0A4C1XGN7_EUMVA|nr:Lipase 3 [Eumeta japonica]